MKRGTATSVSLVVTSFGLLVGCSTDPQAPDSSTHGPGLPPVLQDQSVQINNDRAALEARLTRSSRALYVQAKDAPVPQIGAASKPSDNVQLTLVGEVQPPVVEGQVVQANDVDIRGQMAVVAYNFAGDVFAGAVQVIDFSHPDHPELVSEVLYSHADVNAVAIDGSHVYVGLACDDPTLETPALISELWLTANGLERTDGWLHVPSWAVTDLDLNGDDLVASVGALSGGVALIDRNSLHMSAWASVPDARGVAIDEGGAVLSVCGTESRISRHALPDLALQSRVVVAGYRSPNAKGTIEVASHRSYLGASDGGFQVRGADGQMLACLANAEFSSESPDLMVTNAVTVANNMAFVAAGALGVQVVDLGRYRCDGREADSAYEPRVLGQLDFEENVSSNMVKAKDDVLVVAAGLGGVKLVRMHFAAAASAD